MFRKELQLELNRVSPDTPVLLRERINKSQDRFVNFGDASFEVAVVRWDDDRQGYVYASPDESGETVVVF